MKQCIKILLAAAVFLQAAVLCALELTPAPKELHVSGVRVTFGTEWQMKNAELFPEAAAWIKEDCSARKWNFSGDGIHTVAFKEIEGNGNPEYYTLELNADGVVLGAATKEGMFRAAGRFLAILKQPFSVVDGDLITTEAMSIADWPDFPVRLMSLTMTFWEPYSDQERLDYNKRIIAIMAEHGYNYLAIGIGSNYFSKYFKTGKPTPWTDDDIRELIRFAKARGITPFPYISVISHYGGGPLIAPLLNEAGDPVGHDIQGEEFWKIYPLVLDELIELFDYPPYFRVGGDEANGFFAYIKESPEECSRLFAKTFNFTNEYLKKYNCRTIIWHDMFFAEEMGGKREQIAGIAEGEIIPSPYLLDMVDKDIIINYWFYGADEEYPAIDHFINAGFEVWSSTWFFRWGIFPLANISYRKNVTGYDGTTWCFNHTKGEELILVGEVAWNSQTTEVSYVANEVFMREWSQIPYFANASNATPLVFDNGVILNDYAVDSISVGNLQIACPAPAAAVETVFSSLAVPDDIVRLKEETPTTEIFLKNDQAFGLHPDGINRFRDVGELILYTPSHGKGTGQNIWGNDYVVIDNTVTESLEEIANVSIPENGCVVSTNITGAELQNKLRIMMRDNYVEFILSQRSENNTELPKLEAKCKGSNQLVLVFDTELNIYFDKPTPAAVITVKTADGRSDTFTLNADFCLYPDPNVFPNFQLIYLPEGRAALIWNGGEAAAVEAQVEFTHMGTAVGTVLLGAVEM